MPCGLPCLPEQTRALRAEAEQQGTGHAQLDLICPGLTSLLPFPVFVFPLVSLSREGVPMSEPRPKTLRLLFPQWQGGYDETEYPGQIYAFGARLLAFLAPESPAPAIEVPVPAWHEGIDAPEEGGVFFRSALLAQARAAAKILQEHRPDRVLTFGGDCLVSQSPLAYLNERYEGRLGVLWIDAHPDITTPADFNHAHAMVLGNLLGYGEPDLASLVKKPLSPTQITYVGVDSMFGHESAFLAEHGLNRIGSAAVRADSGPVLEWIEKSGFEQVFIHLDIDVLDPAFFRSQLFANPDVDEYIESEHGKLRLHEVARLLQDVDRATTVAGMSIAEYMPWDALNLKKMLASLSFMH